MSRRILIVEDGLEWRRTLGQIIEDMGYEARTATCLSEVKQFLDSLQFALAVLDINLDGSGFSGEGGQLFYLLCKQYPQIPVIAITGTSVNKEQMRSLFVEYRIRDFIDKASFDVMRFRELIRSEVERGRLGVSSAIRTLANLIRARREAGDQPYTLLLGSSLSLTPEVRQAVCGSDVWEVFWTAIQRRSPAELRALLASPLDSLSLATGYRCLAQLVWAGCFDIVLTLNIDDALDNALRILPASECQILCHGQTPAQEIAVALSRPVPRVKAAKLRADMNAYKLPLTPEGEFEFPKELEEAVEWLLSQDTILVGDVSFDTDIQRCIRPGEGALWMVVPEEPQPGSFLYNAKQARPMGEVISGPEAGFVPFFSALARELGVESDEISYPVLPSLLDRTSFAEIRRFLDQAGFIVRVRPDDPFGLICTSNLPLWANVVPLYVRLARERSLDLEEFKALCTAAEEAYGKDLRGHTAAVVIDRPPCAGDLHQIFALRTQRGLTVVPLSHSLIVQARLDRSEMGILREQVELYTGRSNLYDAPAAVTDVLSFFGRSGLLADLERRLTSGRSAVVFGVRKVGKSSLLSRLREECGWSVALVDLEGYVGGVGHVYREALRGWRTALEATFPDLPLPNWTDDLSTLDSAVQAQAFRQEVGDLLDLLADQPGCPGLFLFLDEIDTLLGQPEYPEFAAILRSVAETPRCRDRFALLAAGLEPTLNRIDRMDNRRNPFFAFFSEVPLGPLELGDARTMVVSIGGQMGISYEDEALDLLVEAGGGHPFLTRQLCSQAIRDLERPGTVDTARAAQAVEEYLSSARNYLAESLWGIDSSGPPLAEAALLRSLATTQPQPMESLIPPSLSPEKQRARRLALDHLRDQSLIRRVEGGLELTIPLYRRWIRRYILNLPDKAAGESD